MTNQELFHAYSSQPHSVSSVDPIKKIYLCDPSFSRVSERLSPYNQSSNSSKHQNVEQSDTTPESSKGNGE